MYEILCPLSSPTFHIIQSNIREPTLIECHTCLHTLGLNHFQTYNLVSVLLKTENNTCNGCQKETKQSHYHKTKKVQLNLLTIRKKRNNTNGYKRKLVVVYCSRLVVCGSTISPSLTHLSGVTRVILPIVTETAVTIFSIVRGFIYDNNWRLWSFPWASVKDWRGKQIQKNSLKLGSI